LGNYLAAAQDKASGDNMEECSQAAQSFLMQQRFDLGIVNPAMIN